MASKFNLKAKTPAQEKSQEDWVQVSQKTGGIKRLTIDLPEELHQRYKIWCATHGKNMVSVIRELINTEIQK